MIDSYKNKKVTIMGLGVIEKGSGFSVARFLARKGAKVIVTDHTKRSQLNSSTINQLKWFKNIKLVLGKHRKEDFKGRDLIVRNPGVHWDSEYLAIAKKEGTPIVNDLSIFFHEIKDKDVKVVGVTGTRGKTTTTYLIYEILKKKYRKKVWIGGNVGNSPLNFVDDIKKGDIVVLEVSSFQLHELKKERFNVAVMTNLLPDHLNFYRSMVEYRKDKENVFKNQTEDDYIVLNRRDPVVKKMIHHTPAYGYYFTEIDFTPKHLKGRHNLANADAAKKVGEIFKVPKNTIRQTIMNFRGVPNRLEMVRKYQGREFYNDTTATSPDAGMAALDAFDEGVILISGGNTKGLDLEEFKDEIAKKAKMLILLPGNANKDLPAGLEAEDMKDAVKKAWEQSEKGDVILLSPGLTWLPVMNEFARGEEFVKEVKKIK